MKSKPVGILLAAGAGQRFGADKLLQPLSDGIPVAVHAAQHLRAALPRVIAVVAPGADTLSQLLAQQGCEVLVNPHPETGMSSSLVSGVASAPEASGWIIALGDMPWIKVDSIAQVAARMATGASLVAPSYGGRRGHPVGLGASRYAAILELQGDQGARSILAGQANQLVLLPVQDPGVLRDVDTPEDLNPSQFASS